MKIVSKLLMFPAQRARRSTIALTLFFADFSLNAHHLKEEHELLTDQIGDEASNLDYALQGLLSKGERGPHSASEVVRIRELLGSLKPWRNSILESVTNGEQEEALYELDSIIRESVEALRHLR
jgi:hypothetical protein